MLTTIIDYVTVKVRLTNTSQGICPAKLIARWLKRSSSSLLALSSFNLCPTRRKCR